MSPPGLVPDFPGNTHSPDRRKRTERARPGGKWERAARNARLQLRGGAKAPRAGGGRYHPSGGGAPSAPAGGCKLQNLVVFGGWTRFARPPRSISRFSLFSSRNRGKSGSQVWNIRGMPKSSLEMAELRRNLEVNVESESKREVKSGIPRQRRSQVGRVCIHSHAVLTCKHAVLTHSTLVL